MTENHLVLLITRHLSGELTGRETEELTQWAQGSPDNQLMLDKVLNEEQLESEVNSWSNIDASKGYMQWKEGVRTRRTARNWRIVGWSVAASLLIAFGINSLNHTSHQETLSGPVIAKAAQVILPGRNTANLTLSNGRTIVLDSAGNGELATQGSVRIVKANSGSLSYIMATGTNEPAAYNTLTTPRSGQYQLTLPDGSRVWLNNISSLRYPTAFKGNDRTVELTGEAYFEIAKDVKRPFYVKVKDQLVEVLGTSFNIMSYPDEGSSQTTLLTGAVRVKGGKMAVELKPDEQAQVSEDGKLKVLKNVPSQDVVCWKEGFFYFGRASFAAVMRQLARWYDVEVVYKGKIPDLEFGGKIDRSLPLNELLKFLDKNQVHFRLEGRSLIVLPS